MSSVTPCCLALWFLGCAAVGPEPPAQTPPSPVRDARGFIAVGESGTVLMHPQRKIVETRGTLNLQYGFLEYLACAPGVKPHETLVALDCQPEELKLALILLGLDEDRARRPESDIDLRPIPGDRVVILLRWTVRDDEGNERQVEKRAEECIFNGLASEAMPNVGWVFTGSLFIEEAPLRPPPTDDRKAGTDDPAPDPPPEPKKVFAPLLTGEFISVCHRPLAILDHPLGIPVPDADYYANPEVLPRVDREEPVEVILTIRRPHPGEIDRTITHMKVPPPREGDDDDSMGGLPEPPRPAKKKPTKEKGGGDGSVR